MDKEKKLDTFEVAYYRGNEFVCVPVCAEKLNYVNGSVHFLIDDETSCIFHEFVYVKRIGDERPQARPFPPLNFSEDQIHLVSSKVCRLRKRANE